MRLRHSVRWSRDGSTSMAGLALPLPRKLTTVEVTQSAVCYKFGRRCGDPWRQLRLASILTTLFDSPLLLGADASAYFASFPRAEGNGDWPPWSPWRLMPIHAKSLISVKRDSLNEMSEREPASASLCSVISLPRFNSVAILPVYSGW